MFWRLGRSMLSAISAQVWDNHRLQHKATTLLMPKGAERVMWRVQTLGPGYKRL